MVTRMIDLLINLVHSHCSCFIILELWSWDKFVDCWEFVVIWVNVAALGIWQTE